VVPQVNIRIVGQGKIVGMENVLLEKENRDSAILYIEALLLIVRSGAVPVTIALTGVGVILLL